MSKVLIDETYYCPDSSTRKFIVVHIIASDDAIAIFRSWYENTFLKDNIRYKDKDKVHYTDQDAAGKSNLVDVVKSLPITAKVYIWCDNREGRPCDIVKWSLGFQRESDPNSEFYIEQSSNEYADLACEDTTIVAAKDMPELALADIYAGVYRQRVERVQDGSAVTRFYTLLRPRIRFECIRWFDGSVKKNTRGDITK